MAGVPLARSGRQPRGAPLGTMSSPTAALFCTTLLIVHGVQRSVCAYNATALSTAVDLLLAEYDRETAPAAPLSVEASLDLRHATVIEAQSIVRVLADLKLMWNDTRLGWNATEWGTDSTQVSADRLWRPEVVLLNAAATADVGDDALRARLSATGDIYWISRIDISAPLTMDLHDWPGDTQTCTFKFGSRTMNVKELELKLSDLKHAVVFESGTWEVLSIVGAAARWVRGPETTSVVSWTVRLARRAPAHAAAAAAALLAAACMMLAAALLPPGARHPLAACVSFTAALWLITALSRLPGAASCPRVLSVLCAVCVCGALQTAAGALVLRLARCSAPAPRRLRAALSMLSGLCTLTPAPDESSSSGAWAATALLTDRALSAALLLTLFVLLAVQLF